MEFKNPMLVVKDMDRAVGFYKKVLGQRVVRFYDPNRHIIEVGENIKVLCRRFWDSGMTQEQVVERMDIPMKFVSVCCD